MRLHAASELADKVAALSRADFYADRNGGVTCIETHMSWVFLTPRYAYKLKKPVRSSFLDFSTLAAREHYCREELRLNRRLAPSVYLDVVPLRRRAGQLQLDGGQFQVNGGQFQVNDESGEVVDYLVKMKRLPAEKMLDRALLEHTLRRGDLRAVAMALAAFYRRAENIAMTPARYRARFAAAIDDNRTQLSAARYGLPQARVACIATAQLDYAASANELAARAAHVIDAHGDLRPEHIYLGERDLGEPLQIIDCLEFQSELRYLDPIEELAFLAMECGRLGSPQAGRALLRMYRVLSGDNISATLAAFYRSHRAMIRAVLAIWHLDDPAISNRKYWRERALRYIEIAEDAIDKGKLCKPIII